MTLTCPHCTKSFEYHRTPTENQLLSASEKKLIEMKLERGEGNKVLAARLGCSEQVVKNKLRRIYKKLSITGAVELALLWYRPLMAKPKPRNGQAA
jgi:DNA-binding NarL/FixJ family response regulator